MKFKIHGRFKKGRIEQVFNKEISATRKELALERVYSHVGSNHKIKRSQVEIISVEELKE